MAVANARMYSVTPAVGAAWKELFAWVLRRADLDWEILDHEAPRPLDELWSRDDLGLAMMCGLPFSRRKPQPTLVAAPIPSPARYGGRPVYTTDIVVRADSTNRSIEDTAGSVVGYTLPDSLSGGVAPKRFLSGIAYRAEVNHLVNARGVIQALVDGRIDIGPLDGYYHDLLRANDPEFASQVRTIATTSALPIPPLVATATLGDHELQRLRNALLAVAERSELEQLRARLLLRGFAVPQASDYLPLARMSE
jgi:ABC-type phosphate/phosphonate transport system substrate-binding protein